MDELIKETLSILRMAWAKHGDGLVYPCSFGGESSVLLDLIHQAELPIPVLTLDTGRLPQATYDFIDEVRAFYGLNVQVVFPDCREVEKMVREHGVNLFRQSPEMRRLCCEIRKVHPLKRVLAGRSAWITGRRREQSPDRKSIQAEEHDAVYGLTKYNPLLNWTWDQVRAYISQRKIPYNRLIDQHYVSIGCECCTRPITVGEDPRAGRWWWESEEAAAECGLHMDPLRGYVGGEGLEGEGI